MSRGKEKNPHYEPCPTPISGDVATDHAVNTWVFNHLPLSEPQKEKLLEELAKEQKLSTDVNPEEEKKTEAPTPVVPPEPSRLEELKKPKRIQTKYVKLRRQYKKEEHRSNLSDKAGIKETTKLS